MSRELFIYWRTPAADRPAAQAAVLAMQARLCQAHPGLQARLYVRQDDEPAGSTLMETYSHGDGIGPGLQQTICQAADAQLRLWCRGARHVEVFQPVSKAEADTP